MLSITDNTVMMLLTIVVKKMMEKIDSELTVSTQHIEENKVISLQERIQQIVAGFFAMLTDDSPRNLYDIALAELELPLLTEVMKRTKGNQSKAAVLLGVSRGTLRKKLKIYGFID